MEESPRAQIAFLSSLIRGSFDGEPAATLLLKDRHRAALARDRLATQLRHLDAPQVVVLDLAGVALTPATLQELVLPLAQRIRGGEYGTVRLVICTPDSGVADFVRYMAEAHQLALYLSASSSDILEGTPIGKLTPTESGTLDTIILLGGQVTASRLAETEGIRPSAATNRLVNLDREGYLLRESRGRREGDVYIEPRSARPVPMVFFEEPFEFGTGPGNPVRPVLSVENDSRTAR